MSIIGGATADDIHFLYERNNSIYYNCKLSGKICPSEIYNTDCYCQIENEPILPFTIGDQCVPCSFKRKVYIKPGEECSICLEPIIQKSTAYLTSCGHSFHKLCAFQVFDKKKRDKHTFSCPLCRAKLGYPEFYCRYTAVFKQADKKKFNQLDLLEEFWLSKNFISIQTCNNGYNHDLGMKNGCKLCIKYRKTGYEY